ncbi:hypothetical protein [Alicyclobacillus dauci]|uniref:Uncharacterized protein n=1 Tax=Alicyclobacillus dauci TaxID=1475485 RepID=A0ABY6Z383_9BACL|nr:hypothetical protein [Alicyclobacillus dauci]WAH36749.1 hypothetical protein NZD86_21665 [Alicyclobacillus dauci]
MWQEASRCKGGDGGSGGSVGGGIGAKVGRVGWPAVAQGQDGPGGLAGHGSGRRRVGQPGSRE